MKFPAGFVIFRELTAAVMTMSICGCVYIFRTVKLMTDSPSDAVMYYYAFPDLVEHIIAGVLFYLAFGLLFCYLLETAQNNNDRS